MRENIDGFFKGEVCKYKWIIKQLLNSVLVEYEELLKASVCVITQTSALIVPDILLDLIQ